MWKFCVYSLFLLISTFSNLSSGGIVNNVKLDPKCVGATLHEFRLTDCTTFPCTVKRGKNYTIEAEFSLVKDVTNPVVRCATVYYGRQISLPGYGGCETISNGTCPLSQDIVYQTITSFVIPHYVPPMLYTVSCRMDDDEGKPLICGQGSGRVV